MSNGGGTLPVLDWNAESAVDGVTQGDAWEAFAPSKEVPRPVGFGYSGCDGSNAFCDYAPGLTCHAAENICVSSQ